jgi:hypothetical protein
MWLVIQIQIYAFIPQAYHPMMDGIYVDSTLTTESK